jgi:TolA-binding protein
MPELKRVGFACLAVLAALAASRAPMNAQPSTLLAQSSSSSVTEEVRLGEPKYRQRIKDLGEQIEMIQGKGFLTKPEADKFMQRIEELRGMEAEARKNGYAKPEADELEKGITLLNEQVFKASHKNNPIKPGPAEKEVNDPNLIPAYPDANLQPGSGKVSK